MLNGDRKRDGDADIADGSHKILNCRLLLEFTRRRDGKQLRLTA